MTALGNLTDQTDLLVMDLDGTCYNMVQEFTNWVHEHVEDLSSYAPSFCPSEYKFWELWGKDDDWFSHTFCSFLRVQGSLSHRKYTIHGFGLALWRHANALKVPVAVVTARRYHGVSPAAASYEWMFEEGLAYDLYLEITPQDSKPKSLAMHLNTDDRSNIITVEDHLDHAIAYHRAGFHSLMVARAWNRNSASYYINLPTGSLQFDGTWVEGQSSVITIPQKANRS